MFTALSIVAVTFALVTFDALSAVAFRIGAVTVFCNLRSMKSWLSPNYF